MRFNSKNQTYNSQRAGTGAFIGPWVATPKSVIDTRSEKLVVTFQLQYERPDGTVGVLDTNDTDAVFTTAHVPTLIEATPGVNVEIIEFINGGGVYDPEKIVQWGQPSFQRVRDYFDPDSVWTDLEFLEQPLKQLAIDWVLNSVKIEGVLLKQWFEYQQPSE